MRESSRRVTLDESKMEPQIVAIGGGGFSAGPENLLLENYVLSLVDKPMGCLGFLPGSSCPHYDGEPLRRPCFQRLVSEGSMIDGYAVDDWVGLHFVGSKLHQVVSAKPNANAYEVSRDGVGFHE